jgi:hypothetical protein
MKTPVALLIFKRPDTTAQVFEAIRKAKPPKLFIIADGPRVARPDEAEQCMAARAVVENVDWDCEVIRNYSDINLGCGVRPATGISWVFEQVEEAIILEDDCVPNPTFFQFCDELLERYREDERVLHISGSNYQLGRTRGKYSYYFSRHPHCWGWASWRRAWQHYDFKMEKWRDVRRSNLLVNVHQSQRIAKYWSRIFDETISMHESAKGNSSNVHIWTINGLLPVWLMNGFSIIPNVNLVSNIGFGESATHTLRKSKHSQMSVSNINFPLKHPPSIVWNKQLIILHMKLYLRLIF